jgi:signal transduction histidine kinase/CheY-like chemotaxis protein
MLNCKRAMVTMIAGPNAYVVAESTRTLSISAPHTSDPGDEIWIGGGTIVPTQGSLCENVVSLIPPPNLEDDFYFEIRDLKKDPQYGEAEFVNKWPFHRFYCATPLRTRNGVSIGTLCVFDDKPKPSGLPEVESMTLANLGDAVMNYLQVKQGDRDLKKGKLMEMGLSKFIAEGFHPTDGLEMTERRDGRLWSEKILEQRRLKEMERKKKVDEKRALIQERKFAEMMKEREEAWQKEMEKVRRQYAEIDRKLSPETADISPLSAFNNLEQQTDQFSPRRRPSTTLESIFDPTSPDDNPSIYIAPPPSLRSRTCCPGPQTCGPIHVRKEQEVSLMESMMNSSARRPSTPSRSSTSFTPFQRDTLLTPPPSNFSSVSGPREEHYFGTEAETHEEEDHEADADIDSEISSNDSFDGPRRRSEYEQTSSFEPHVRAMFFRAASLIKNAIDANVLFLDADLEGFFSNEDCEHAAYSSHISTDKDVERDTRAQRPKACRRRSGILGYATEGGSSSTANSFDSVESLGFDVSELNEKYLNQLVEENPQGRIVTRLEDYEVSHDEEDNQTDCILKRFLPGAKSVVLVPLVDHSRKPFAVCVAWTTCSTRSFCGDVEGSFVTAVTNTIVSETTKLNILNADKAKGEFISSISHELRSPLHGILASAEFLAESNLDAYQRSFVGTVISCGKTLLDTINHVLDFQKLNYLHEIKVSDSGTADIGGDKINHIEQIKLQQVKQQSDVDVSCLVQEIVDGVCLGSGFRLSGDHEDSISGTVYREDDKKLTVIVDIDNREDGWVFRLNPAGLKRVINNITGNAMKYTESGWVRIRLRTEDIDGPPDEYGNRRAMVKISISDSGKGISRSFLKTKLFTPFSQENPLASGAGLGMSIVRQIVGAMDGKIDVKSQVGKGTKVTVQVPMIFRPKPSANLEINNIKLRGLSMKARIIGFEAPMDVKQSKVEAANYLRDSVIRYTRDYLGFQVQEEREPIDPDVLIVNELTIANLREINQLRREIPVILVCRHPPMDGGAAKLSSRISTFIRKPCGPKKFVRAMAYCLDEMDKRKTDLGYVTAPDGFYNYSTSAESSQRLQSLSDSSFLAPGMTRSPTAISAISFCERDLMTPAITPACAESFKMDSFFGEELAAWRSTSPGIQEIQEANAIAQLSTSPDSGLEMSDVPPSLERPIVSGKPSIAEKQKAGWKPTVLAVEDNTINLMLLKTFLEKKGYQFDTAVNGLEALKKVKQKEGGYDVILMDLRKLPLHQHVHGLRLIVVAEMPIMSGIESTREIRKYEEGRADKSFVVALTGLAAISDQKEAYAAGIDSFMVKPVNFRELEKTLTEGLRRSFDED